MVNEVVELKILKKDVYYLYKVLRQNHFDAEKNYNKTMDEKPINDIWKDTLEANERITTEIERSGAL